MNNLVRNNLITTISHIGKHSFILLNTGGCKSESLLLLSVINVVLVFKLDPTEAERAVEITCISDVNMLMPENNQLYEDLSFKSKNFHNDLTQAWHRGQLALLMTQSGTGLTSKCGIPLVFKKCNKTHSTLSGLNGFVMFCSHRHENSYEAQNLSNRCCGFARKWFIRPK